MSLPTRQRELITPEGVDLRVNLATGGARAGAFIIDIGIILAAMTALTLLLAAIGMAVREPWIGEVAVTLWLIGAFLARNAYFVGFELGPRAATPGKRIMKLRVAARNGGRLTADAIFARNALRELEIYLPITLLGGQAVGGDVEGWMYGAGLVWACIFLFFPLFNRDRLRPGDLAAGTWVVQQPRPALVRDLAEPDDLMGFAPGAPRFQFDEAQLQAYGVKELHVLEDVLRVRDAKVVAEVAKRIRGKIGWTAAADEADLVFLRAYYAGLRHRLEGRLLFGHRRIDKHDRA